jgi:hypothetical protein
MPHDTVLRGDNAVFWAVLQTGQVTPLAIGGPGTAKTKSIEAFGRAARRPVYTLIGSIREPADIGGYPYPVQHEVVTDPVSGKKQTVYMALLPPKWAVDCHNGDGRPWILFFDELTCNAPAVQAAMLGVITEKRVGDLSLPPETWIGAACNPAGQAAGGYELEPPMANRLYHHPWAIDTDAWDMGMLSGLRFPEPRFTVLPETWKDHLGANGARFAAFRRARPSLVYQYPEEDRAKAGGPWPSPRSITSACICATAVEAISTDVALRYQAIAGCVGDDWAHEFRQWEQALDLPDPEEVLAKAMAAIGAARPVEDGFLPGRADQVLAFLGALADRVLRHGNTRQRWEAGMEILGLVWKSWKELAVIGGAALAQGYKAGYRVPAEFSGQALPLMVRAGMVQGGVP